MNLWIPDQAGQEAIGELPAEVLLRRFARDREPPPEITDAEFLVPRSGDPGIGELVRRMPALRVIQTLSAGVDWVPSPPAGVMLCDAGGTRDVNVSEWVLAAILAATKTLPELRDRQREHVWAWRKSGELHGSTVMILGYGSIGAAVEARLAPFGVELIRVARHARAGVHAVGELESLIGRADTIVVLLPLTGETRGLLGGEMLSRMRSGALLVNAARGAILDTAALLELLRAGRVRAVLDVTEPEPLAPDHPLWDAPGCVITPHFAGDTAAADSRAFALVGEQVRRHLRGEPLENIVSDGY